MASRASVPELGPKPRIGIIGGSGVQIEGREKITVSTPYGNCQVTCLDDDRRVLFVNRHLCTTFDSDGIATYAPPHLINFQAMMWALIVECSCKEGIVAIGSTGSLHPDKIPVGSVVMATDYYQVRTEPITFWDQPTVGTFEVPEAGVGRIHYTPCNTADDRWVAWCKRIQEVIAPVFPAFDQKVKLATGQTPEIWPCVHTNIVTSKVEEQIVYVSTAGARFETRAEIRSYQGIGHIVGMTCAREWTLCEELCTPYCLICFCDNACNGLSTHPQGALQEYLDHKQGITEVTGAVVDKLVAGLLTSDNLKRKSCDVE